jgi:hypothetical protein
MDIETLRHFDGSLDDPTWLVHTWLSNDQDLYRAAGEAAKAGPGSLRAFVEDLVLGEELPPEPTQDRSKWIVAGLARALLRGVLADVDWDLMSAALDGE